MRRYRQWITWIVPAVAIGIILLFNVSYYGRIPQFESRNTASIKVWVYSKPVVEYLNEFERQHPGMNIEVRQFRSSEQLFIELKAAITANIPPQLAEIDSTLGIDELADTGQLLQLNDELISDNGKLLDGRFVSPFLYKEKLWAVPYGGSLPALYYNADMLAAAGIDKSMLSPLTWKKMIYVGQKLTLDVNKDGIPDIWGLEADGDTPWYLGNLIQMQNSDYETAEKEAVQLWHNLVNRSDIMPPLHNHLATSDFINGKAAFLFSATNQRTMLERYIGGKFEFGVLPFPEVNGHKELWPRISGFIHFSNSAEEGTARELLQYLISTDVQQNLMHNTGQFPVRTDIIDQLDREEKWSDKEQAVLSMLARIPNSEEILKYSDALWQHLLELQKEIENSPLR